LSDASTLSFLQVERLLQTEASFNQGDFEAMLELFVFIIALVLNSEHLKDSFIEQMMDLDEEI